MAKKRPEPIDTREASLRVSRRVRNQLKMTAAVLGRPLHEVTNEAMESCVVASSLPVRTQHCVGRARPGSPVRWRLPEKAR
jgi:hypothetical protein